MKRILLMTVLATLAAAAPAHAANLTVTGTADGTGSCMAGSCTTIRAALAQAAVQLGPDVITLPTALAYHVDTPLTVNSDVTLTGTSATNVIIRGLNPTRVLDVPSGVTATVSHMSLSPLAQTSARDGGIIGNAGTLTLDHVDMRDGHVIGNGGAIANTGTLTIRSSLLSSVSASNLGGAIYSPTVTASVTLVDSTITASNAATGGAISMPNGGSLTLTRATVARNNSTAGAALDVHSPANATAAGTIVANNSGGDCGLVKPADLGGNVATGTSCGFTAATSRQNADPGLSGAVVNVSGGETAVLTIPGTSPAVDLGAPCPAAFDQRDLPRGQGTGCDAGAFEVDQVPDTVITTGPAGATPKLDARFRFASSEPGTTFQCRLDQVGVPGTFTACTSPFFQPATSGTFTFYVRAVDATGNIDPTPATSTFTIQAGAQLLTVAGPSGPTRDASPTFTFSAPDVGAQFECRFNAAAFTPCTSPITYDNVPDGSFVFQVQVSIDGVLTGPLGRTGSIDTGDPQTTITSGPDGPTNSTSASFAFSADETSTFRCRLDGPNAANGTFAACTSPQSYANLADGVYTFFAEATDQLGNRDATPAQRLFGVDTVAPPAPTLSLPADGTLQNTSTVQVRALSETGTTVRVLDNGVILGDAAYTIPIWQLNATNLLDGQHVFAARAIDPAGNPSPLSNTRTVRIDTVAPAAPVIASPDAGATVRSSTVTLSGTAEPDSTISGAGTTTATGGAWTLELTNVPDGPHTYILHATDAAGNASAAATRTITVDTTPVVTPTPEPTATAIPLPAPTPTPTVAPAGRQTPTVTVARVSGTARIKPLGGAFAPLTAAQTVPFGVTVDATKGTVRVTNAKQSITAKGATFTVTQNKDLTLLKTASCSRPFTVDTRTGGFTTRTGKMQVSARKSAKWKVSNRCHKLTVLRGTVIGG